MILRGVPQNIARRVSRWPLLIIHPWASRLLKESLPKVLPKLLMRITSIIGGGVGGEKKAVDKNDVKKEVP